MLLNGSDGEVILGPSTSVLLRMLAEHLLELLHDPDRCQVVLVTLPETTHRYRDWKPEGHGSVDLHDAIETVARRSDSLVQFVDSYRQITRLAPPEKKRTRLADLFETVLRLARAECPREDIEFSVEVNPSELDVYADTVLLEPVLINLLRNAWQATESIDKPVIRLSGRLNRRHNVVIEV